VFAPAKGQARDGTEEQDSCKEWLVEGAGWCLVGCGGLRRRDRHGEGIGRGAGRQGGGIEGSGGEIRQPGGRERDGAGQIVLGLNGEGETCAGAGEDGLGGAAGGGEGEVGGWRSCSYCDELRR
jgi:hypothetical protein